MKASKFMLCLLFVASTFHIFSQDAIITTKKAGTIMKSVIVYKIDGQWGETFWGFAYMFNNWKNAKLEETLKPGSHTLEVMYETETPVKITFLAEAGKEYEIVKHEESIKVLCLSDETYVGTGIPIMFNPENIPEEENLGSLEQDEKIIIGKEKFQIRIMKIDSLYGPYNASLEFNYVFNNPKNKKAIDVKLQPGKHTLEYYVFNSGTKSSPNTIEFETEAGKSYEIKINYTENTDKETKKYIKGFFEGEVVEKSM